MMKKRHILHWAMGVVMTPLLGSCAADFVGDAGMEGSRGDVKEVIIVCTKTSEASPHSI